MRSSAWVTNTRGAFVEIELSRGMKAIVSDDDFARVACFSWHALSSRGSFYAARTVKIGGVTAKILMHREIVAAAKGFVVDHIDHNTLNNSRANLRVCTPSENSRNSKTRKDSRSGIRCVKLESRGGGIFQYRATIRCNKKAYRKWFHDLQSAALWCEKRRLELHGEFSYDSGADSRLALTTKDA